MRVIDQYHVILTDISDGGIDELQRIEQAGRVAYKSINFDGDFTKTKNFIQRLISSGHESVLEHSSMTVQFTTDRGVTHELVRHRLASYTQESTRYCNYSKGKFGSELTFIRPVIFDKTTDGFVEFYRACQSAEEYYMKLLEVGWTPEFARAVLPNAIKADIVMTANYREWRHMLKLRTANDAHPQIRALMRSFADELHQRIPIIFDDIPGTEGGTNV